MTCGLCCNKCQNSFPLRASTSPTNPFLLSNLFPAGTLQCVNSLLWHCSHEHTEDSWHNLSKSFSHEFPSLETTEDEMCRRMNFLVTYDFIRATICRRSSDIVIRVYIVPYDLPGLAGKLRISNRDPKVLALAREYMSDLLRQLDRSQASWNGMEGQKEPFLAYTADTRTLSGIYSDLPSPSPNIIPSHDITRRLLDDNDDLEGLGLRSSLKRYQRRSVATMFSLETRTFHLPDPLFVSVHCVHNKQTFYLQPGTLEILQEQPIVEPCHGGILCEELGTGKTIISLSLILSTLKELSKPESRILETSPVFTAMSFRNLSSASNETRQKYKRKRKSIPPPKTGIPSFSSLLLHKLATEPDIRIPSSVDQVEVLEDRLALIQERHEATRTLNAPFYLDFPVMPLESRRGERNRLDVGPRKIYLTSATLIAIPSNLMTQWRSEIDKHCSVNLRVLMLRNTGPIPDAPVLATDYDIVLITYGRISLENQCRKIEDSRSWTVCTCPEDESINTPTCICPKRFKSLSPLLQIRWKRFIIDEGHVSAAFSTSLNTFSQLLSVERRWIVTGTPTTNLLGLGLGQASTHSSRAGSPADGINGENDSNESAEVYSVDFSPPPIAEGRIWTTSDRGDIYKLMSMLTHFVRFPRFLWDARLVQTHIKEPLFLRQGPFPGAIQVLTQVMSMFMIRHRIADVEREVSLKPVVQEAIFLDLDPYAIISYNAHLATFAINAVDSQRKDQDYLFHPSNASHLQTALQNLSQLMFWSVDDQLYNAVELSKSSERTLQRIIDRGDPPEDIQLMRDASRHIGRAVQNMAWRSIQEYVDVPFRMSGIPDSILRSWYRMQEVDDHLHSEGFFYPDQLKILRESVTKNPLVSLEKLNSIGAKFSLMNDMQRNMASLHKTKASSEGGNKTKGRPGIVLPSEGAASKVMSEQKEKAAARRAAAQDTICEIQKELEATLMRLQDDSAPKAHPSAPVGISATLMPQCALRNARVRTSVSSKLNYIINEVLAHSKTEKILIFSESALTLSHVAEALDVISVKYLRFTTQVKPQYREQLVMTFETSEMFRVFLMDLKHGARGLNLISASRIIFCEPVWQADVESQAIKRAHRIGQTKAISVKTLAIRGTAEEKMVMRRTELHNKLPKLTEEAGMRDFIEHPTFIETAPVDLPQVDYQLLNVLPVEDDTSSKRVHITDEEEGTIVIKRRKVSFV